jgi:oligopeptide transport system permease protein
MTAYEATGVAELEPLATRPQRNLWSDAFRRLIRNRLAVVSMIVLAIIATGAFAADYVGPLERYDPYQDQDFAHLQEKPSSDHFFGTDNLGRDNWARVLAGVRISLQIAIGTQIVVVLIGVTVGSLAALGGKTIDNLLMRATDIAYAFPDLLFIILMRAVLLDSTAPIISDERVQIILAIGLITWTTLARLVRGQMLSLQQRDFVTAARAMGAPRTRVVFQHMLPNTLGPVIVAVTFGIPLAIFAEAALGFLGFGLSPPTASLGRLVSDGYAYIQTNTWIVIFPAIAIAMMMLCFTFIGDGLRDALDPRSR